MEEKENTPCRKLKIWSAFAPLFIYVALLGIAHWKGGQVSVLGMVFESNLSAREVVLTVIFVPAYLTFWFKSLINCMKHRAST